MPRLTISAASLVFGVCDFVTMVRRRPDGLVKTAEHTFSPWRGKQRYGTTQISQSNIIIISLLLTLGRHRRRRRRRRRRHH